MYRQFGLSLKQCYIEWPKKGYWRRNQPRGPFHLRFFDRNSNSTEISPCCNSVAGSQVAPNLCTCHDNTAVVPCTKFCSDHCITIEVSVKRNYHRIWIAMEKPLVKRGPGRVPDCRHPLSQVWHPDSSKWPGRILAEMINHFIWLVCVNHYNQTNALHIVFSVRWRLSVVLTT